MDLNINIKSKKLRKTNIILHNNNIYTYNYNTLQ